MPKPHLLVLFALTLAGNVSAYGPDGHQAIGKIAESHLKGTRAMEMVRSLLRKKEGLDTAATWMDRAKLPDKYLSSEMKEFIENNPDHHTFHYCDVPFQQKTWKPGLTGTNPHDIVRIMEICIGVLKSPEAHPKNPLKISKRIALLMLAHLVGDLHQPLHVGCGYVDEQDRFVDPESGAKGQDDAGGNFLRIRIRSGRTLHSYWDSATVDAAQTRLGTEDFPMALMKAHAAKPEWDAKGPVETWPTQWATDTLQLAAASYDGIQPRDRIFVPKNEKHGEHHEWLITLPDGYAEKSRDTVEVQLSKSGYRLAVLLKAIWPEGK